MDEIQEVVKEMENESKALKLEIYKLAWYMRGALSIEQAYMMDYEDREIIVKIVHENIENSKETGMALI